MATIPLTISGIKEAQAQLKALGDEFDRLKDDPIESKRLAKEFNTLSKEIDKTEKAFDELNEQMGFVQGTFEEIYGGGLQPMTTQIGELEDRLYQLAIQGKQNSEEFKAMTARVSDLRANIRETDRQIDLLAENRGFAVFGTGITQVGESLLRLDFEGASRDAKALNNAVGNLGTMGAKALKGLGSTVGQLSKAFLKMGASLLLNPVFLLATAITAIVVAIGALLNELGFLQPILDAIGAVFGWIKDAIMSVVQALKDFTDWLGITNHAGKAFAEQMVSDLDKLNKKNAEVIGNITDNLDHEIAIRRANGEDTVEIELKKQKALIQSAEIAQKSIELEIEARKKLGDISEEEQAKFDERLKEQAKIIKDANQEIELIQVNADVAEDKRREDKIKKDAEAYKKRLAEQKAFEQERLRVARQIQDIELQLEEEGINKDLEVSKIKYERLIEDLQNNEKLTSEEKQRLTALYAEQEFEAEKAIRLRYDQELQDALDKANEERRAKEEEARQAKLEADKAYLDAVNKQLEKQRQEDLANEQAYAEAKAGLTDSLVGSFGQLATALEKEGVRTAGLQKTLALVEIATSTARAIGNVVAGATQASLAGGPLAPFLIAGYVASGIATVTSAVLSAKQVLEGAPSIGGGGGGSIANPASVSTAQPAQPSFDLFGQNNNANNLSAPQDVETNQTIEVKAVVSETEVTETQNTVQKIIQNSSL